MSTETMITKSTSFGISPEEWIEGHRDITGDPGSDG